MELNLEEIERQEESPFIERFEEFFNLEYKKEIENTKEYLSLINGLMKNISGSNFFTFVITGQP